MPKFWAHTARFFCLLSKPQASGLVWAWACALLLFVPNVYAGQVTLAWDAVSSPSLSGYRLYYGQQSGSYSSYHNVASTTPTDSVPELTDGQTYYFAVTAYDADEESAFSNEVSVTIGAIPQQQMQVVSVDSQELVGENGAATRTIDGNPATFWHTEWSQRTAPLPHTLVLDLGASYQVDGFRYLPRQDGDVNGTMAGYQFYVSTDGTTWGTAVSAGTLAANTTEKTVRFTAKTGRYVRLVALSEMNGQPWTSVAELNVFRTTVPPPTMTLSAAPTLIAAGQAATLTWSSTNATACAAAGWTASTATAGTQPVKPTSTASYTMTCTGAGGTASASTTVTVPPPPPPISVKLSAAPTLIAAGQAATLTWSSTNATACAAAAGWTASTATSGTQTVKPTSTTSYTMTCTGAGGTASASTTVTLKPSVTLSAAPASIAAGQASTLTWSSTNATACAAAAGWTASTATSGTQTVKPTSTTSYTMTCTGAGGTASASTTVTLKPSVTLSAAPASIAAGQASTLTWSSTNATACAAAAGWTASTATSGTQTVKPTSTTSYTMTCTGAGGTASASTTVTLKPSVTLSAAPASIAAGQASTLTWSSTNATACAAAAGWTASTTTAGTQTVKPTSTTPYTMTCTGAGGTVSASTTITVPPPPTMKLSAAPALLAAGQAAILTWSSSNTTACAAAGWTASTATSGSHTVTPTSTTPYTMKCTGTGGTASASTTVTVNPPPGILIPQQQFRVVSVDSEELVGENGAATNAIDGNPATFWHTEWSQRTAPLPHTLVLDLGASYQVDGFRYLPRQDGDVNGTMAGYQFYVSTDGTTWGTAVVADTLAANTTEKTVRFPAKTGRYVRLVALSEMNGQPWTSAAELNVFGTAVVSTPTSSLIPQQQFHVVSVDSQELVGENGAATNAIDGNPATFWHTEWSQRTAPLPHTLVLDLGASYQVDGFRYLPRQDGDVNGTMAGYQFYVSTDGTTWGTAVVADTLAANTTEKTVRFPAKTGRYVRLVALSEMNGQPWTSAAELNVFGTAVVSTPTSSLIPQQQFHVVSVDSQELVGENGAATNAIDGNPATFWHTEWSQRTAPLPHTLVLDLGASYQVDGFRYLPRQDGDVNGTMAGYQFYVSTDGTTWGTAVSAGTLAANTTEKTVRFPAKTGRYVRLVALSEMNGQPWTSAAEFNVFGSVTQPTGSAPTAAVSATPTSAPAPLAATSAKTAPPSPKPVAAVSATPTRSVAPSPVTSTATAPPMAKPVAAFSATLISGRLPLKVPFTDASTGSITTWVWDFGDSSTSTLRQPSHTYTTPGTYTVKLTVTGPGGSDTATKTGYITVAPALLEVGDVTADYVWKRIAFRQKFVDPIVVATSLSSNDFAPAIIRIRNVGPTGFEIRVQEWDYLDGVHLPETVSYLAMERGSHTLGTGIRVEAGRMTTNQAASWSTVSFQPGFFKVAPVLLTAVNSFNEADAVVTRVDGVSAGGFQIRLQEQISKPQQHVTESIDYIAWEPSAGTVDGLHFEVKATAQVVTEQVYTLRFAEPFLASPMFLAGMQTAGGTDPASLRWDHKDQTQVVIQLQEEVSTAHNLTHPAEVVGYMAFTYP